MTMNKLTTTVNKRESNHIQVLVVLDERHLEMADAMRTAHDHDSRSAYIRRLIRDDFRRYQRRQLAAQKQAA